MTLRFVLAFLLGVPLAEVLAYQSVQRHGDGRISFRRQLSPDVWEFRVLHFPR